MLEVSPYLRAVHRVSEVGYLGKLTADACSKLLKIEATP